MTNLFADISIRKAARIVGFAILIMAFLAFFVDDFILSNLIAPGDTAALANDIKANALAIKQEVMEYLSGSNSILLIKNVTVS